MTEARDLLIRDATLPDGRTGQDLLILAGRIAAVGPALAAEDFSHSALYSADYQRRFRGRDTRAGS